MHALVSPQVSQRAAGVAALVAAVRLLPGVGAGVALQVDELGRGVGADGAAVRLLAVVGPHVALQVVGVARGEGAQRAGEQFSREVAGSVRLAARLRVGVAAHGSVSRVRPVQLRGGFVLEAVLTGLTIKLRPQVEAHTCNTGNHTSVSLIHHTSDPLHSSVEPKMINTSTKHERKNLY